MLQNMRRNQYRKPRSYHELPKKCISATGGVLLLGTYFAIRTPCATEMPLHAQCRYPGP